MSYYKYDESNPRPATRIQIDQLSLGEIKIALYYCQYVGNLSGKQREYIALSILAEKLGFKLSDDLKTLIVPNEFEIT